VNRRRWGKAGVRLTQQEVERNGWRAARRLHVDESLREKWAAGRVVPGRITSALDLRMLYGPEVDHECGVEEPAVDQWEAGELYPTWEQIVALARLTDFPLKYFFEPMDCTPFRENSLRFVGVEPSVRVAEFSEHVWRPVVAANS
jgi:hypothetical protein